jgi:hypothetical protein
VPMCEYLFSAPGTLSPADSLSCVTAVQVVGAGGDDSNCSVWYSLAFPRFFPLKINQTNVCQWWPSLGAGTSAPHHGWAATTALRAVNAGGGGDRTKCRLSQVNRIFVISSSSPANRRKDVIYKTHLILRRWERARRRRRSERSCLSRAIKLTVPIVPAYQPLAMSLKKETKN